MKSRATNISCDFFDGQTGCMENEYALGNEEEAFQYFDELGWLTVDGKDYCPNHSVAHQHT